MSSDHDAGGPVPFEAPHRAKSCLEAPVVSFDSVVGVLGGVMERSRQEFCYHSDQGVGPVSRDLDWLAMGGDRRGEEPCRSLQVSLLGHEHVDDLPILVNGPVDVSPGPRHLHVSLIDEPVTADAVAAWAGRVDEQGRESLNPSEQGHMVDLDTPFGEEFLKVPVGQSVAQVPGTAIRMTSGGNLKPANAALGDWTGRVRRRCFTRTASSINEGARSPTDRGEISLNATAVSYTHLRAHETVL